MASRFKVVPHRRGGPTGPYPRLRPLKLPHSGMVGAFGGTGIPDQYGRSQDSQIWGIGDPVYSDLRPDGSRLNLQQQEAIRRQRLGLQQIPFPPSIPGGGQQGWQNSQTGQGGSLSQRMGPLGHAYGGGYGGSVGHQQAAAAAYQPQQFAGPNAAAKQQAAQAAWQLQQQAAQHPMPGVAPEGAGGGGTDQYTGYWGDTIREMDANPNRKWRMKGSKDFLTREDLIAKAQANPNAKLRAGYDSYGKIGKRSNRPAGHENRVGGSGRSQYDGSAGPGRVAAGGNYWARKHAQMKANPRMKVYQGSGTKGHQYTLDEVAQLAKDKPNVRATGRSRKKKSDGTWGEWKTKDQHRADKRQRNVARGGRIYG